MGLFSSALSIGGALLGGLGGGSKTGTTAAPASGFAALPKEVQDAWLKTYLPDVLANYDQPFQPVPMVRANAPRPIAASMLNPSTPPAAPPPADPAAPPPDHLVPPAANPATPNMSFDSQELHKLQQFSDAVGGFFSPTDAPLTQVYDPQPTPAPTPAPRAGGKYADMVRDNIMESRAWEGRGGYAPIRNLLYNQDALTAMGGVLEEKMKRHPGVDFSGAGQFKQLIEALMEKGQWNDTWYQG